MSLLAALSCTLTVYWANSVKCLVRLLPLLNYSKNTTSHSLGEIDLRDSIFTLLGYRLQCFLHILAPSLSMCPCSICENIICKCELQHGRQWSAVHIHVGSDVQLPIRRGTNFSINAGAIHPTILQLTLRSPNQEFKIA